MASSIGFRMLSFLPSRYSSYGAWTLTPVGLAPTDHASLRWTHRSSFLIRPDLAQQAFGPASMKLLHFQSSGFSTSPRLTDFHPRESKVGSRWGPRREIGTAPG